MIVVFLWVFLAVAGILAVSVLRFRGRSMETTWFGVLGVKTTRDFFVFISVLAIAIFIIVVLCLSLGGIVALPVMA